MALGLGRPKHMVASRSGRRVVGPGGAGRQALTFFACRSEQRIYISIRTIPGRNPQNVDCNVPKLGAHWQAREV